MADIDIAHPQRHGKSRAAAIWARLVAKSRPGVTRVLVVGARGERLVELGPDGNPVIDVRPSR